MQTRVNKVFSLVDICHQQDPRRFLRYFFPGYSLASMSRASVTEPPCPMGIRSEHITEFERLLYVVPKYDASSSAEYTIKHDSNDTTLFTVTGKKYGDRPVREFRDASGLPLFEVQRPLTWMTWRMQRLWQVRLPGDEGTDLVRVKTRRAGTQFVLVFRNVVAKDAKSEEEKLVTVEVCSNAAAYWRYDVTVDGRKVVDIRESMERNRTTSILQPYPQRMVLEILVADGFDLSLASLIALMVSDVRYGPDPQGR